MNAVIDRLAADMGLEAQAAALLAEAGRAVRLPAGQVLFRPGDACPHYVLVVEGCIAVRGLLEGGREILYYRVRPGQTCFQTTLCLLSDGRYTAEGVVEAPLLAVLLPPTGFEALLAGSAAFRRYAFRSFAERLQGLTGQVAQVAFRPLPARLALALLDRGEDVLSVTHEALARELGVAREAVSRALGEWEKAGLVGLSRGRVTLLDRPGLAALIEE